MSPPNAKELAKVRAKAAKEEKERLKAERKAEVISEKEAAKAVKAARKAEEAKEKAAAKSGKAPEVQRPLSTQLVDAKKMPNTYLDPTLVGAEEMTNEERLLLAHHNAQAIKQYAKKESLLAPAPAPAPSISTPTSARRDSEEILVRKKSDPDVFPAGSTKKKTSFSSVLGFFCGCFRRDKKKPEHKTVSVSKKMN